MSRLEVMQSVASSSGITFPYTPPILPPGTYQIDATAWDSAGFTRTLSKNLTVNRLFGFFGVSNIVRTVNTTCNENLPPFLPCNTTTFSATLNLENHTTAASGPLRIRLIAVPGSAFQEEVVASAVAGSGGIDFRFNRASKSLSS